MAQVTLSFDTILPCVTCGHPGTEHYCPPFPEDVGYEGTSCTRAECRCEWYIEPDWAPSWDVLGPDPSSWQGELVATMEGGAQYRSTDGGETWVQL